ncbi:aminoglycoside phosphotransferase family protein [Allostreptomyces psammosilenae]|uniref:Aminoglycoside phosphotransferase domain-containing protein n=1 Tax=Allostreptomyces psammosilenae TaxID=1892865 RepID=A0A852ZXA4_9ACTN|nr:aminoglycoside phosphotransferase family protein [Allostreptomyces psammosilenae]NYI06357.1 hypothetical protein [Allostreptomyces psammosilenae]
MASHDHSPAGDLLAGVPLDGRPSSGRLGSPAPRRPADADPALPAALGRLGRAATGSHTGVTVLADRQDATVVRVGAVVVKAHPPEAEEGALRRRLAVAAHPLTAASLLPPLSPASPREQGAAVPDGPGPHRVGGRLATLWPAGRPVDPRDPDAAPWEECGRLLAALHAVPLERLERDTGPLPPAGAPGRVTRALDILRRDVARGGPAWLRRAARAVEAAAGTVPPATRAPAPGAPAPGAAAPDGRVALTHGDFHLGQVVMAPAGRWRLIDVDDLGRGDPAWDLARPAAWYAAGLLPAAIWERFMDAYLAAGGPCFRGTRTDLWGRLDPPARALTVQMCALRLAEAFREDREPDEDEAALVAACERIAASGPAVLP